MVNTRRRSPTYDQALRLAARQHKLLHHSKRCHRASVGALPGPNFGQYEEAVADYDQALRLQPDNTNFYIIRSDAKAELGQSRRRSPDQALRLQPDNTNFYIIRSDAKAELGQYREAVADLEAGLELAREAGDSELITLIEGKIEELEQDE